MKSQANIIIKEHNGFVHRLPHTWRKFSYTWAERHRFHILKKEKKRKNCRISLEQKAAVVKFFVPIGTVQ